VVHLTYAPVGNNRSSNRRPPLFVRILPMLADWTPEDPATHPIAEIGVGPDDLVLLRNTGLSPTYGTETYKLLRNMGIRTIVMAGISVNVAIPVAATEATDEDFDVLIPRDAVAGSPPEHVASMLRNTLAFIGTLCTVDELLGGWGVADIAATG
jgi:nicotinamidase-related amidase